jgi:hypothetical protein
MAGIGHRHRLVVLVASPGASLPTARRGASSWIGAWAPLQLAHVVMSRFSWGVNRRHHPRNGDRQQRVRASQSWCAQPASSGDCGPNRMNFFWTPARRIWDSREYVKEGALLSYGPNFPPTPDWVAPARARARACARKNYAYQNWSALVCLQRAFSA